MKVIKVVYDNDNSFILDIVNEVKGKNIIEAYNLNNRKESKKGRSILTTLGTKLTPVIAIEDENLELIAGIWSENNPNWREELIKKLR